MKEILTFILENDELLLLRRKPSDLRRYIAWTRGIKAQYGSVTEYITQNRLPADWGRPPFTATAAVPFASPSDYVVLINDWPYGLDPGIIHLVVWSRAQILVDLKTGRMTPESQGLVQDFVQNSFVSSLGPGQEDKVTWFKNPVSLQSVRALEHIHVLVRGVDDDTIERWTGRRPPRV